MKMAYGTYAMPMFPLDKALRSVAEIGYDGVEFTIGADHNSMPNTWDTARCQQVENLLTDLDLGVPAFFILKYVYTDNASAHKANLQLTRQVAKLVKVLDLGTDPVVSIMLGGRSALWETQRSQFVRLLKDYARLAADEKVTLAFEPHCHAAVDRTERALWLMKTIDNPLVRLHFDIVHFSLAGDPIVETVAKLVPYTAHTHLTDVHVHDGGFDSALIGEGQLDCTAYVSAMHKTGWESYITVEVSRMIWGKEDYDPLRAARLSYDNLNRAFKEAGVPRG